MPRPHLIAALLCLTVAGTASASPTFRVTPDTLRADADGTWNLWIEVANDTGTRGVYADSLLVRYRNDDPDRSREPAQGGYELDALGRMIPPSGVGERNGITYSAPAAFDRGTLVFRFVAHDDERSYVMESTVHVVGNAFSETHPPVMLQVGTQRTDMVVIGARDASGPARTLLFVPPAGVPARSLMRWGTGVAARGWNVGIVSLPGAGRSTGERDGAGPASVAVVGAAVRELARTAGVDPARIVLWGEREGGTTALLAADSKSPVQGVVAVDAWLDPWAAYRALDDADQRAFRTAAGSDSAAWRARSALVAATRPTVPVLLVQSSEARAADTGPATAYEAARRAKGLAVETRLSPSEPRPLRKPDVQRIVLGFAERRTGSGN